MPYAGKIKAKVTLKALYLPTKVIKQFPKGIT